MAEELKNKEPYLAWPGVAIKTARGRSCYYWTRTDPWIRLPDPFWDAEGFMRKLVHLERVQLWATTARAATLVDAIRLFRESPDLSSRAARIRASYDVHLDRLLAIFPYARLDDLTPELLQRYVIDEHDNTPGAANMMLRALHIVVEWTAKRNIDLVDPKSALDRYETATIKAKSRARGRKHQQ